MSTEEIVSLARDKHEQNEQRNALVLLLETYCADLTWQHAAELFHEAFPPRYEQKAS